jgi:hypothetical protein
LLSTSRSPLFWRAAAACFLVLSLVAVSGCRDRSGAQSNSRSEDLLAGLTPMASFNARRVGCLTDEVVAIDGDDWRTDLATLLLPGSWVQFDLGHLTPLGAAYLQGDGNDRYSLSLSDDGKVFRQGWTAEARPGSGLKSRAILLHERARYVRVSPLSGDGLYSVSEVALYSDPPRSFPPTFVARRGVSEESALRARILWFGLALAAFTLLSSSRASRWVKLGLFGIPILALTELFAALTELSPVEPREVSLLRATVAAVALVAVCREGFPFRRWPSESRAILVALGVSAALALACFANLGRPQFWDAKADQPSFIHNYDMRVYFPVAKYFRELGFDGVYLASAAAFFDDLPDVSPTTHGSVQIRDLDIDRVRPISALSAEIAQSKRRFTPARWQEFKADMRYFRETMGAGAYLETLTDHGANATPVWLTIAHVIFRHARASNLTLLATACLDPFLLLVAFVGIGISFGWRTTLVCATVFGANDYYVGGSTWFGSTLRHDWMAALALGLCALKSKKWSLGGALLALAASLRAFPVLALVTMILPGAWQFYDQRGRYGERWSVKRLLGEQRPVLAALGGASAFVIVAWLSSAAVLGADAWLIWFNKVRVLDHAAHLNHLSSRGLVGFYAGSTFENMKGSPALLGWPWLQAQIFRYRAGLVPLISVCFCVMVLRATRHQRLEQAALLGLILVPVLLNPANYYLHLIFLFPMLLGEDQSGQSATPRRALIWGCLLAMCVAQYQTVLEARRDLHYYHATLILFAVLLLLFALMARQPSPTQRPAPKVSAQIN